MITRDASDDVEEKIELLPDEGTLSRYAKWPWILIGAWVSNTALSRFYEQENAGLCLMTCTAAKMCKLLGLNFIFTMFADDSAPVTEMTPREVMGNTILAMLLWFVIYNLAYEHFVTNKAIKQLYAKRLARSDRHYIRPEDEREMVRTHTDAALEELKASQKFREHITDRESNEQFKKPFEPVDFEESQMDVILAQIDKEIAATK